MRFAYLGYDAFFYCLQALLRAGHTPTAVFSFPVDGVYEKNDRLRQFAEKEKLPFSPARVTEDTLSRLYRTGTELVFVAGYIYRLPNVSFFPVLNFHPAPLPIGRGAWPMPTAILRGECLWGCAVHKVAPAFDAGDLLGRQLFSLTGTETLPALEKKIEHAAEKLLPSLFADLPAAIENAHPQAGGDYRRDPPEQEAVLFPTAPSIVLDRMLRAFYGYGVTLRTAAGDRRIVRGAWLPNGAPCPLGAHILPAAEGRIAIFEEVPAARTPLL